jgi:hypothetical protein
MRFKFGRQGKFGIVYDEVKDKTYKLPLPQYDLFRAILTVDPDVAAMVLERR